MTVTVSGPAGQTIEIPGYDTVHPELATAIQDAANTKAELDQARRTKTDRDQIAKLQDAADTAFHSARNLANVEAHQWTGHLDAQLRTAVADINDHLAAAADAAMRAGHLLRTRQIATSERPWELTARSIPASDDANRAAFLATGIQELLRLPQITEHRK